MKITLDERAKNACQLYETLERNHATVNRERFIAIVSDALRAAVADEREACARVADGFSDTWIKTSYDLSPARITAAAFRDIARAIRARGPASGVPPAADKQAESGSGT